MNGSSNRVDSDPMRITLTIAACVLLAACSSTTQSVSITTPDQAVDLLTEAGFECPDPEVIEPDNDDGGIVDFTIVDCGRFAMDLIPDMTAWESQFAQECSFLSDPEQREVLGEIELVLGQNWLVRSRDYGEVVQWQPGAQPNDFVIAFGGQSETWAQTCERLGAWD
jgi:hypothetical protein